MSSTSGSAERSSGRTILAVILGIIALLFIVVAIIYVAEPAKSLPSFIPGHIAGSTGHHPLKATGSLVVGIIFAVLWVVALRMGDAALRRAEQFEAYVGVGPTR